MADTILVVEDEDKLRNIVHDELKDNNFNVLTAQNGAEALKIIEESMPDLIILDMKLPDMTGVEILGTIRERDTEVPVIVCTAVPLNKFKTYYDRWASKAMDKPVDLNSLVNTVRAELAKVKEKKGK